MLTPRFNIRQKPESCWPWVLSEGQPCGPRRVDGWQRAFWGGPERPSQESAPYTRPSERDCQTPAPAFEMLVAFRKGCCSLHLLQALATGQQGVQGGVPRGRVSHSTGGRSKRWSSWSTSGSTALCHWVLDEEEAQCGDVSEHSQLFMFTPIPYLEWMAKIESICLLACLPWL